MPQLRHCWHGQKCEPEVPGVPPKVICKTVQMAGKAKKRINKGDKMKKKRKRKESYAIYIYKALKQFHSDTVVSSKVIRPLRCFVLP